MSPRHQSRLGITFVAAVAAVVFLVTACSGATASPSSAKTLKVVATTTVFADIIRNVGGDLVTVEFDHPSRCRARGLRAQAG